VCALPALPALVAAQQQQQQQQQQHQQPTEPILRLTHLPLSESRTMVEADVQLAAPEPMQPFVMPVRLSDGFASAGSDGSAGGVYGRRRRTCEPTCSATGVARPTVKRFSPAHTE
jgi:hypothetical protein